MAVMCLLCLGIFWLLPTGVPPAGIDWRLYPEMAMIKDVDTGGNACPSLHVASAVFHRRLARADIRHRQCTVGHALAELAALPGHPVVHHRHASARGARCRGGAVVGLIFGLLGLRHALRTAPQGVI